MKEVIRGLIEKGVRVPYPEGVDVGEEVSPDRISGEGVTLYPGCRIYGEKTLILAHAEIGYEGPATLRDCQVGRGVKLKGGFFEGSTFLEGVEFGSGAHVRGACLLEEGVRCAHAVGLKHTILMPFVTLGSLINFCDCLMAGGTDRKNHSEVGSSYIHFNYTPNQDKATPSLLGDVPRGVMLNQPPIFLGGQGGLVGPVMVDYGTVVAAGNILRKDTRKGNRIIFSQTALTKSLPFHPGLYTNIKRVVSLNINYISNLIALRRWYRDVRARFVAAGTMEEQLHLGALDKIEAAIEERVKRLGDLAAMMPRSIEIYTRIAGDNASKKIIESQREFCDRRQDLEQAFRKGFETEGDPERREKFLMIVEKNRDDPGQDYVSVIKGLSEEESRAGTSWLHDIVEKVSESALGLLPRFK
ncbi:MAG: hypothetical protein JRH06_15170 [Deltaproteobacteria bacterium]|nr:hypothetical protein [Deltaproteobacteria bacterium]MBW2138877.1 hypothetical protein [Deltaproteobacteria bacterium]